ncbi:hypothetical protein BJ875DRAFT_494729 [Amylocarpus encephaloides]|uniref:Uncharacterized protein n=1 Tax=Amylocarpus encephaloides TaxID=45428 RepID=A0A9P7YM90_9HELO|nr:hypothetical protein BJ875DRAFT_494729 [Amylocarpus encephaloides]
MQTIALSDLNGFLHTLTEPTYPSLPRGPWLHPGTYTIDDTTTFESVSGKFTWRPLSPSSLRLTLSFSPNSDSIPRLFGIDTASEPGEITERFRLAEGVDIEFGIEESEKAVEEDGDGAVFLMARGGMRIEVFKGPRRGGRGASWIIFMKGVECLVEGDSVGYVG